MAPDAGGADVTVRILQGDCREVLSTMPDESVNCIVTSPPYWGLRDYGHAGQLGLESTPQEYVEKLVAVFEEVRRVLRADGTLWLNLGDSYNAYNGGAGPSSSLSKGAQTNERPALPSGYGLRFKGLKPKDLVGIPWRVAFALQQAGWYLRQDIIWSKPNPMPESVRDRCTKAHEYIFLLSKSERYYFDAAAIAEPTVLPPDAACNRWDRDQSALAIPPGNNPQKRPTRTQGKHSTQDKQSSGHRIVENVARARAEGAGHDNPFGSTRNKRSVWTVTTQPFKEAHFATFPPALIEPCILAGCPEGGTVLDPFGGAGTTGLVADRMHRNAILIELNPEYAAMAEKRIRGDSPLFAEVA